MIDAPFDSRSRDASRLSRTSARSRDASRLSCIPAPSRDASRLSRIPLIMGHDPSCHWVTTHHASRPIMGDDSRHFCSFGADFAGAFLRAPAGPEHLAGGPGRAVVCSTPLTPRRDKPRTGPPPKSSPKVRVRAVSRFLFPAFLRQFCSFGADFANWSPIGHQLITNWSPIDHKLITNGSPIGHQQI